MKRLGVLLCSLWFCSSTLGCGGQDAVESPSIHLEIAPPDDASCIGVSGFEIEVVVQGDEPRTSFLQRTKPVLSRDACVVDRPMIFGEINLDATVEVVVRGYDGARQLRVEASGSFVSLRDVEKLSMQLVAAGSASLPIVAIDRTRDLITGTPIDNIESIELAVPGKSKLAFIIDDEVRPFFHVGEPWAVSYPAVLVAGDELTAKVTLAQGGVVSEKLVISATVSGDYFEAAP